MEIWRDYHPPQHAHRSPSVEVSVEGGVCFVKPRSNTLHGDRCRCLKADCVGPGGGFVVRAREGVGEGGGGYSIVACFRVFTVDHASLSSRNTVPTPAKKGTQHWECIYMTTSCTSSNILSFMASCGHHPSGCANGNGHVAPCASSTPTYRAFPSSRPRFSRLL